MSYLPYSRPELHETLKRLRQLLNKGVTRTGNYDIWWEESGSRITVTHYREVIFEGSTLSPNYWSSADLDFDDLLTHLRGAMVLDDLANA